MSRQMQAIERAGLVVDQSEAQRVCLLAHSHRSANVHLLVDAAQTEKIAA
jgi:hypothetical protein